MNKYYLCTDYGTSGYELREFDTLEEATNEIEREMLEDYTNVVQYRIFSSAEMGEGK
jgi:hypothetical protein